MTSDGVRKTAEEVRAVTHAQAEFVDKLVQGLVPTIQNLIKENPPPNGNVGSGVAGFMQAFVEIAFNLAIAGRINARDVARGFRLMADDIENQLLADPAEAPRAAPSTVLSDLKVDF